MPAPEPDSLTARRAFVVVIDALGAGAEPDAADYGDAGANTLLHVAERCGGLRVPALEHLGLGNILPLPGVTPSPAPVVHGRLSHQGPGKDSTTGHWELMGVVTETALPTFPDGVPEPIVTRIEAAMGRRTCGGGVMDGLAAIAQFGPRHLETGELILYTSVDSVLQLAGHVDVIDEAALIAACAAARAELTGPDAVGRVIARPFAGAPGAFERTHGRRDFAVPPPGRSHLDALHDRGVPVHAVGKVDDLFTGRGIDEAHAGATNLEALAALDRLVDGLPSGLAMANLVETDQLYGHRKDVVGFHRALQEIDAAVGAWLLRLRPGDLLVITADHGVDPALPHYDHTREQVPLLAAFPAHRHGRHDGAMADVGASALRWLTGEDEPALPGSAFV